MKKAVLFLLAAVLFLTAVGCTQERVMTDRDTVTTTTDAVAVTDGVASTTTVTTTTTTTVSVATTTTAPTTVTSTTMVVTTTTTVKETATTTNQTEKSYRVVGVKEDGIVVDMYSRGYVYVKLSADDPKIGLLQTAVIAFTESDLLPADGAFTDFEGQEQRYAFVLENPYSIRLPAAGEPTFG